MSPSRRQLLKGIAAAPALVALPAPPPVAALAASPGGWVDFLNGMDRAVYPLGDHPFLDRCPPDCPCCLAEAAWHAEQEAEFALAT
jgi:hypothetical protein